MTEETKDLWKHRSKTMKCITCMWFVNKQREGKGDAKEIGRCRKNAPTIDGYPVVFANDWCWQHKIDENK